MSGVLRLTNDGGGSGRSTIVADANNDQTFRLPEAGGTLLTSNYSVPGGTITFDGSDINITNGDLNVDSGTLFVDESTNRVGIGTITPETTLQLDAGTGTDSELDLRMGTGNSGLNKSAITWSNSVGSEIFKTYFNNAAGVGEFIVNSTLGGAGDIVRINRQGKIGINTAPGNTGLTIKDTVSNSSGSILLVSNSNTDGFQFTARNDGAAVQLANNASSGALWFFTNSSTDGVGLARSLAIESDTRNISLRSHNGSSGGLSTSDTSALIFRGGNSTQQANLVSLNAAVNNSWAGEFQIKTKGADANINTEPNISVIRQVSRNSEYYAALNSDVPTYLLNYQQSPNYALTGETPANIYRRSNTDHNIPCSESAINQQNSRAEWEFRMVVDHRGGSGANRYLFYRLYLHTFIGDRTKRNFYDISYSDRTAGGTTTPFSIDILDYNIPGTGVAASFWYRQIPNVGLYISVRFQETYSAYDLVKLSPQFSSFDNFLIDNRTDWSDYTSLSTNVRTLSTT